MVPTYDYRLTDIQKPDKLLTGLDALVLKTYGATKRKFNRFSILSENAQFVQSKVDQISNITNSNLTVELKKWQSTFLKGGKISEEDQLISLAYIVEAANRTLHLKIYPEQIMGAIALSKNYLTEMATGEGKTITIALAAVKNGWSGRACHIITANDYLAQRDTASLQKFYSFCHVSVGFVISKMADKNRRESYLNNVVYATSKEIVADFLRDRLRMGKLQDASRRMIHRLLYARSPLDQHLVMNGLHTAIVDEADSLLIDEAITPLIISKPQKNKDLVDACQVAARIANKLKEDVHYTVNELLKKIELKDTADEIIQEECKSIDSYYRALQWMKELVTQSLVANIYFIKGKQYVVKKNEVIIVDEYTGRLMHGRKWKQGLHQAIEAKESIRITDPSESLARLSFQKFFKYFKSLSAITGSGKEAANEFWYVYGLPFIEIPTHRPCKREVYKTKIFKDAQSKWDAIIDEVIELNKTGRPILIGTRNVTASEHLGKLLNSHSINFHLLNAVRSREEATIIAAAGQKGNITISTNMAGRGTDIKLHKGVEELGGLHVIATEYHESERIDRQLYGRTARQGEVGSVRVFVSLEDELYQRYLSKFMKWIVRIFYNNQLPGFYSITKKSFRRAQATAEKLYYKQRRSVIRQDNWYEDIFGRNEKLH